MRRFPLWKLMLGMALFGPAILAMKWAWQARDPRASMVIVLWAACFTWFYATVLYSWPTDQSSDSPGKR